MQTAPSKMRLQGSGTFPKPSRVCFSWMCTYQGPHRFWKPRLQCSTAVEQGKREKKTERVIYKELLLDISICDLKLPSNVETQSCSSKSSRRAVLLPSFSCPHCSSPDLPVSLEEVTAGVPARQPFPSCFWSCSGFSRAPVWPEVGKTGAGCTARAVPSFGRAGEETKNELQR